MMMIKSVYLITRYTCIFDGLLAAGSDEGSDDDKGTSPAAWMSHHIYAHIEGICISLADAVAVYSQSQHRYV